MPDTQDLIAVIDQPSGYPIGWRSAARPPVFVAAPIIMGRSATPVAHTGTTAETTLASVTIPGGLLGPSGVVRVWSLWSMTNSANSKTMRHRLGTQSLASYAITTNSQLRMSCVVMNRGEAAQVFGSGTAGFADAANTGAPGAGAVDTTQDQTVNFTATLAAAGETITLEAWMVEVMPSEG
jgi:hypothetical protein